MVRFHGDGAEALERATLSKVPLPASSAERLSAQRAFVECVEVGPFWWEDKKQNTIPSWTGSQPQLLRQDSHLSGYWWDKDSFGNRLTCKFLHQPAMHQPAKNTRWLWTMYNSTLLANVIWREKDGGIVQGRCCETLQKSFFFFPSSKSITVNSTVPSFLLYQLLLFHFLQITRRAFTRRLR